MRDGACGDPYHPDGGPGSMWCTNRGLGIADESVPTYGVRNQIGVGMKEIDPQNWINPRYEYPPGVNQQGAINFFRFNLAGLSPFPGTYAGPLYLTNRFYAPYEVTRNIYVYTSWQANDPLMHYMVNDLRNLVQTNNVELDTTVNSTIPNLGRINDRYEPWTGTLTAHSTSKTLYDLRLKDPLDNKADPELTRLLLNNADGFLKHTRYGPLTFLSARELHLIVAEAALAAGDNTGFQNAINAERAVDGLTAYTGAGPTALVMLQYERQRNLFLQGKRLLDEYRFGTNADLWQGGSEAIADPGTFLPITISERIANSFCLADPALCGGR